MADRIGRLMLRRGAAVAATARVCRSTTSRAMVTAERSGSRQVPINGASAVGMGYGGVGSSKGKGIKRSYDAVFVERSKHTEGAWAVLLDEKPVRTPKGEALEVPSMSLAEALAEEWRAQTEKIKPLEMPLTTLACTTVDLVRPDRAACITRALSYLSTDTVCYEDENKLLAERQLKEWQPLRHWFNERFGVALEVARGFGVSPHPEGTLETVKAELQSRSDWELCAIEVATASAKSLIVAMALLDRADVSAEDALRWAHLEELFQIDRWGMVEGEHDVSHAENRRWFEATQLFARTSREGTVE